MPTLTLVRGLPGAGKSTYFQHLAGEAEKEQKELPVHYEADMFFCRHGKYVFIPTLLGAAHNWCIKKTAEMLRRGRDVVVTNTFHRASELRPYLKMAEFAEVKVICLQVSADTSARRTTHRVPRKTIDKYAARWQNFPGELIINTED